MQVLKLLPAVLAAGALMAQHGYTQADIESGGRLYRANCSACHGPNGDSQPGVDLGHGRFRRAKSDEELAAIITHGIPGTAMPAGNFSESAALTIVAYLHSMAAAGSAVPTGDPAHGKEIVEGKGNCLSCHRVGTRGSRVGPDLTDIGTLRRSGDLLRSLTDPDAEVLAQNRYFRVVTKSGQAATGRLLNEDTFTIQMIDASEHLVTYRKADLREYAFVEKSPMPSYRGRLTDAELADVVGYLISLKGL